MRLPVSPASHDGPFLTSAEGPVWPVIDERSRTLLGMVAESFGALMTEVEASPGARLGSTGLVCALESQRREGELYAHLTGRAFQAIDSHNRLSDLHPDILVLLHRDCTIALMAMLDTIDSSIGLIVAETPELLHRQVIHRSAAYHLSRTPVNRITYMLPTLRLGRIDCGTTTIIGSDAGSDAMRDMLRTGQDLLCIMTHADGVDASLGRGVLCPFASSMPDIREEDRRPACVVTGRCHRKTIPLDAIPATGDFIDPGSIRAKVLLFETCWGFLPWDSTIDARWSLGRQLLDNPSIGSLVTRWRIVQTSPETLHGMSALVASGSTLGEMVRRVRDRSREGGGDFEGLCILGDPNTRFRPAPANDVIERFFAPVAARVGAPGAARERTFLEAFLGFQKERGSTHPLLASSLDLLERASLPGHPAMAATERASMLGSVASVLSAKGGMPLHDWRWLATTTTRVDHPKRPSCSCGAPVTGYRAEFGNAAHARDYAICARCGMVEDRPAGAPTLSFHVERDSHAIVVEREEPTTEAHLRILLEYPEEEMRVAFDARFGSNLPPRVPHGEHPLGSIPTHIALFVVTEKNFSVFRQFTYY